MNQSQSNVTRYQWLDVIRGIAILWIFVNHTVERLFGYPYIGNPSADWPPFAERLSQLRPLEGYGIWNIAVNVFRYIGWFGDQGVALFIIASGFGLTLGILSRSGDGPLPLKIFYRRRAERIYPLWWGAHLLFIATGVLIGSGISLKGSEWFWSLLGIRLTEKLFYFFAPSWWFIGLLLQLYLIYPLLWEGFRRLGTLKALMITLAISFSVRGLGLLFFDSYMDAWQRGAIFITRLPEFSFGVAFAFWMKSFPDRGEAKIRSSLTLVVAAVMYVVGDTLSLTLLGMTIAPFVLGVSLFVLLYLAFGGGPSTKNTLTGIMSWVGIHSYSLFMIHHPIVNYLVPKGFELGWEIPFRIIMAALVTVFVALALERGVTGAQTVLGSWCAKVGFRNIVLRIAGLVLFVMGLLVSTELLVRWVAPQEPSNISGWGERPSLEPHPEFGWRLRPLAETHLRWESYDYWVKSNSLGFPGSEYPVAKPAGTLRILTTGDAFTSAEGVNTDLAWPRLLEVDLAKRLKPRPVEVMNFAISGYGPNQYAAIMERYAPIYRPDLIIIGFFANDYQDVLQSKEDVQKWIGFRLRPAGNWRYVIRLAHLRQLIRLELTEKLREVFRKKPREHGYFLGNFLALERGHEEFEITGRRLAEERLKQIKAVAEKVGAKVIIVMIPAPVQICGPKQLAYYPRHVDLNDKNRFDLELPQRLTKEITTTLDLGYYDLRPLFRSRDGECPYQPRNMHWTAAGHRTVAGHLAELLVSEGYVN